MVKENASHLESLRPQRVGAAIWVVAEVATALERLQIAKRGLPRQPQARGDLRRSQVLLSEAEGFENAERLKHPLYNVVLSVPPPQVATAVARLQSLCAHRKWVGNPAIPMKESVRIHR